MATISEKVHTLIEAKNDPKNDLYTYLRTQTPGVFGKMKYGTKLASGEAKKVITALKKTFKTEKSLQKALAQLNKEWALVLTAGAAKELNKFAASVNSKTKFVETTQMPPRPMG